MTTADPWESDPEFLAWKKDVEENLIPMIRDSAVAMTLFSPDPDVKLAVELGMCLLLGKPIVLVVAKGQVVPPALAKIAIEVIYVDWDDSTATQVAIAAVAERVKALLEAEGK